MDNDNIDFKDLWKRQAVSQPNIDDLFSKLKDFKRVNLRKLVLINVLLVATCGFIIFIWYHYQPEFISTKIGIVMVILAIVMSVVYSSRLLRTYKEIDETQTNQDYLQKLILIKKKEEYMHSKVLSLYFIMLGLGICLYMYECVQRMTVFYGFLAYGLTLFWFGLNWFYFRPKQIKKQMEKVNSLISKFEEVNKQLDIE
ncbi:hypothetical protein [Flavobacterium aestivum]|uniref:hypothetical protein n=1 Tax=Flavobacterium aestivum TaxID=3003257 RepID=UPI0022862E1B|nr:hypothetical protein [Flavobacterium aestivum]